MNALSRFNRLFPAKASLIGMIHVPALPGTPVNELSMAAIQERVLEEAHILESAGMEGIMLENMHDVPYLKGNVGPEITATMAVLGKKVREQSSLPLGMQILAGANKEALAAALAAELDFIRVEGFVFGHVADEGWIESSAAQLLRARKAWGAEHIAIFADIKKKHSAHTTTADVDLAETAHAAEFFRADGVIITGSATGSPASAVEVQQVKQACELPVLVGSGINPENIGAFAPFADAYIVGSYVKEGGKWDAPLSQERIQRLIAARDHSLS